ncbi:unnamed protein product [Adineta ricciae]|uniref:Uncharacterized protein n=1 Tax=Adineta ricciae TaxID=249248 RepID=A0A814PI96_ADIRI|nr:unnamed protein product [Adineta ricciae]
MFLFNKLNLFLFLFLILIIEISGISHNRPKLSFDALWNENGTTILNETLIGSDPLDFFIDQNNTVYIPNRHTGDILLFSQGNLTQTIRLNLTNSSTIFVQNIDEIYLDTFYLIQTGGGVISKITSNLTIYPISRMNLCHQCFDIFIHNNDLLYCSFTERHQIIAKSLIHPSYPLVMVAGTGQPGSTSTTLRYPHGIFIDNSTSDLYVADCENNRIQKFEFGKLIGITIVGNQSLSNFTFDLNCPTSIILDFDGNFFVVDSGNHRMIRQGRNGFDCFVNCDRTSGSSSSQLNSPWTLNFDNEGNLYVIDRRNNRMQKFKLIHSGYWTTTGNTNVVRCWHTASILSNGNVLVTGGDDGGSAHSSTELYDPSTGIWILTGSMNVPRRYHVASLLFNGSVLVTGGSNGFSYVSSTELYDPSTGIWTLTGSMNAVRHAHTASLLLNGTILVTGGWNSGPLNSAELYDPSTGIWTPTGNMNVARSGHTASTLSNGTILVISGSSVELYDPSAGIWTLTGSMNAARSGHTASVLSNGKVLVTGGDNSGNVLNSSELYDPPTGIWTLTGNMNFLRRSYTTSILSNGKILVTGGYDGNCHKNAGLY